MNEDIDCIIEYMGTPFFRGLPYCVQPENIDSWPSAAVSMQAAATLRAILDAGYEGVRFDGYKLSDGRAVLNLMTNLVTPEGRLAQTLWHFASQGIGFDTGEMLAMLKQIYREQGLPMPTPKASSHGTK